MQRVVRSADPYAAAELAAMIKEQAAAIVEDMSKNTNKKMHRAAESDQEGDDEESNDEDSGTNKNKNGKDDSDEVSDEDGSPYAWIGKWIQKPKGERCRNSKDGREGFTTARLLKRARITKRQYSMYKVRL